MISLPFRLAVLDSSVVIKWFRVSEPLHEQALILRSAYADGVLDLAVPDLLVYEIANALRYKTDLTIAEVCSAVQSLLDMDVAVIPVSAQLVQRAVQLARTYDVTVYDAVFVACTEHLTATLVTADQALLRDLGGHPSVICLGDIPVG